MDRTDMPPGMITAHTPAPVAADDACVLCGRWRCRCTEQTTGEAR